MKAKLRKRVFTVFFMFAVTFVSISIVAGISLATMDEVQKNRTLSTKKAVMEACGIPAPASPSEVDAWFVSSASPASPSNDVFLVRDSASGFHGKALVMSGKGLWGRIVTVVGVEDSGALGGLSILEQNETPGLGARISEKWFLLQVRGRRGTLRMNPEGTRSRAQSEIDAITGATITSKAVLDMLNRALDRSSAETGS